MTYTLKTHAMLTRRGFGLGLGAVASLPLLGRKALAFESADVVVVGGGLAGLNAALNLEAEGYSVIVLEAADYIGGRTRTLDLPIGPVNAGGQTIGPYYARVRDLAHRLGVSMIPAPGRVATGNYVNGELVASKDWSGSKANKTVGAERVIQPGSMEFHYMASNNPLPDVESWTDGGQAHLDVSIARYMLGKGASEEALRLAAVTMNVFDLSTGSALAYLRDLKRLAWGMENTDDKSRSTYGASASDGFEYNEIAGGTQRLSEAMAGALKGEVRLNQPVRSILMTGESVEVQTANGDRFKSKYVVSAVPFSALRNIDVFPHFKGTQRTAVRHSGHGNTVRVFMEYSAPFWEDDIGEAGLYTDTAIERVFALTNEEGEIYGLNCWVNGNAAYRLDQLPTEVVGDFVVETLGKIRPASKGKVRALKVHSWAKHSASGCCRHVFEAGQVTEWADVMAKPHNRLHLAGEQTRSIENGLEAAAKSGERAAFEIMELLG
ncbi:MAG: NAD(P)/FAD-dependent oxidoreductase [Rhodospirillaceae bacterium]|nr:NAD(P)/FAD-dependent oxidoreductase [Rhodospirillaceae bacterium]